MLPPCCWAIAAATGASGGNFDAARESLIPLLVQGKETGKELDGSWSATDQMVDSAGLR
jgi:hypothetical protein